MVPNVYEIAFLCNAQVSGVGLRVVSPLSPRLVLVPGEKGEGRGKGRRELPYLFLRPVDEFFI